MNSNFRMDETELQNPWNVERLEDFLYYCCPECDQRNVTQSAFVKHAVVNHPKSHEFIDLLEDTNPTNPIFTVKEVSVKLKRLSESEIRTHTKNIQPPKIVTKKQIPNSEFRFKCNKCNFVCDSDTDWVIHDLFFHEKDNKISKAKKYKNQTSENVDIDDDMDNIEPLKTYADELSEVDDLKQEDPENCELEPSEPKTIKESEFGPYG